MKFRCPNCNHAIQVGDDDDFALDEPLDVIECPSCHSRVSLSSDGEPTVAMPEGERIAHFTVLRMLGEGAFGMVYLARDEELQRTIALKVPRTDRVNTRTEDAFLREARAAAACEHPNLVRVYEAGRFEGHYYISMQYIDGITLSEYAKTHAISTTDSARLLIKVLQATQVFHDRNLVHRDLKPGNIILDSRQEPFITDFGLAKTVRPDEITVTHSGQIVGTLHYMSPEQVRAAADIDRRSDIYALGVILYQLLTGERPFKPQSEHTLLYAILHDDPPAPRKLNPKIPRDLETICLKAMEKDPARRYESASQMAESLQLFLDGKPIPDKPVSRVEKAVKWVRRNRALSATMGIACALMAALAIAFGMSERRPTNYVTAVLSTEPSATGIVFTLYDDALRVPDRDGFTATSANGEPVDLLPGLYKVTASDDAGRFHEVWRTVPRRADRNPADWRFPHLYFAWTDDGHVALPQVRLWADDDIKEEMELLPGGEFDMGYQQPGGLAGKHRHAVGKFWIGVNEVSHSRFREVLATPIPWASPKVTWLEEFDHQFGDRSEVPGNEPVAGYPHDVAILFCELVGCRLPTNAEYEFAATWRHDEPGIPTTGSAVGSTIPNRQIPADGGDTDDGSAGGVRNLTSGVGEYTDSVVFQYRELFPSLFANYENNSFPPELRNAFRNVVEVRGAPLSWVHENAPFANFNVREPVPLEKYPSPGAGGAVFRVGWRVYRSGR